MGQRVNWDRGLFRLTLALSVCLASTVVIARWEHLVSALDVLNGLGWLMRDISEADRAEHISQEVSRADLIGEVNRRIGAARDELVSTANASVWAFMLVFSIYFVLRYVLLGFKTEKAVTTPQIPPKKP